MQNGQRLLSPHQLAQLLSMLIRLLRYSLRLQQMHRCQVDIIMKYLIGEAKIAEQQEDII